MKIEQQFGYYTINEQNQYHSYDDEPAIIVEDHKEIDIDTKDEIDIEGYKAWYENGELLKVERKDEITFLKE